MECSNEKLQALDQIENQVYQMMQSATNALNEFSKDKPSIKNVESQVTQFLRTLDNVESSVSKQIRYLTQVSTLQPHEGSTYASMKVNQMAFQRLEHARTCVSELEHLKLKHQMQLQRFQKARAQKMEEATQEGMENKQIKTESHQ